jgi:hypothetical protein
VITPKETESGKAGFNFTYTAGDQSLPQGTENNALNRRRDKILQFAPAMIDGAKGDDEIWLQLALQALQSFFTAVLVRDAEAIGAAVELLKSPEIGWPAGSWAELLLKDQRDQAAQIDLSDT